MCGNGAEIILIIIQKKKVTDPVVPKTNYGIVVRGGSWKDDARACSSFLRNHYFQDYNFTYLGFRIVLVSDE